jgi:hypothetical protein
MEKGHFIRYSIVMLVAAMVLLFSSNELLLAQPKKESSSAILATTDGETPGVRVEVVELKRVSGGTLNLKFVLINDGEKTMDFGYALGDSSNSSIDYNSIGGVHLIDGVGKKKYFVIRDSERKCLCSQGLKGVVPKSRMNLWAKFPAPPDNVEKITVVIPHFIPMDDVPISR